MARTYEYKYTVFGATFIEKSQNHFLYINAKNIETKENHLIVQSINGSHSDVLNKFGDLHHFDDKDCVKDYYEEIYGHNVDDFFDQLDRGQRHDPNDGLPF